MRLMWICLGGAAGTAVRYGVGTWLNAAWPYGTWTVNIVGSFLMGVVMYAGIDADALSLTTRVALATGFLGGLTTYSAFAYDTVDAMRAGAWSTAFINFALTTMCCLLACSGGLALARWWFAR